jgi:anthranilate phosphoribosyltransferase
MLGKMIEKLLKREDLSKEESALALLDMLAGANPHQIAAFLLLIRAKGESVEELHGIVEVMRSRMVRVQAATAVLDIVGTGGDGAHTLNISTASAILAASCGVKIAKHGNRSVSSSAGSADVLEALGIALHQSPEQIGRSIEEIGIGFMFAPDFHPAFKQLKEIRKGLGTRTLFNMIGPLLNPAGAQHFMLGVCSRDFVEITASLLSRLNVGKSLVFHGCGLDELSCMGPSYVIEVLGEEKRELVIDPLHFGLKRCSLEDLRGQSAQYNAQKLLKTFAGEEGAFADTIALNAGFAAYLYGVTKTPEEGVELARAHLKEKKALHLLEQWRNYV